MLLKKVHEALPAGGALIVYERLVDDDRRVNAPALLASLNMLIMTAGGFDFTGTDCTSWMREAGFHHVRVESLSRKFRWSWDTSELQAARSGELPRSAMSALCPVCG